MMLRGKLHTFVTQTFYRGLTTAKLSLRSRKGGIAKSGMNAGRRDFGKAGERALSCSTLSATVRKLVFFTGVFPPPNSRALYGFKLVLLAKEDHLSQFLFMFGPHRTTGTTFINRSFSDWEGFHLSAASSECPGGTILLSEQY